MISAFPFLCSRVPVDMIFQRAYISNDGVLDRDVLLRELLKPWIPWGEFVVIPSDIS